MYFFDIVISGFDKYLKMFTQFFDIVFSVFYFICRTISNHFRLRSHHNILQSTCCSVAMAIKSILLSNE